MLTLMRMIFEKSIRDAVAVRESRQCVDSEISNFERIGEFAKADRRWLINLTEEPTEELVDSRIRDKNDHRDFVGNINGWRRMPGMGG